MPQATVQVPSMLLNCTDGNNHFPVQGETLAQALNDLFTKYPRLKTHLYQQDGTQREHVNLFLNADNTRWLDNLNIPLPKDAEITITQAVSGG